MKKLWDTIRGFLWWTHDRGSLQYDVMVVVILLFIFVAPRYFNFKDRPAEPTAHQTGVIVEPDGHGGFYYSIKASAVNQAGGADVDETLLRIIEPIAGEVRVEDYSTITDPAGRITAYRVHVRRP